MRSLHVVAVVVVVLLSGACVSVEDAPTSDASWVGTMTTEGNVTTVINESGSVWGGAATLVEETSIGVEAGERHYMFARLTAITADEEYIYVGEGRPPVVRVYDHDGVHVRDIGSQGQGPGEFGYPASVVIGPDGTVLVRDDGNARFSEFSPEGELIRTWAPWPGGFGTNAPTVVAPERGVYVPALLSRDPETGRNTFGYRHWGPEGEIGDPLVRPRVEYEPPMLWRGSRRAAVPLAPGKVTALAPFGAWIVGVSNDYRFEIRHFDGSVVIVEKAADPIPISDDEREWEVRRTTASYRRTLPDWSWNGPPIGDHLPTFSSFEPDLSGRVWVRVYAASTPVADCDPDPQPGEQAVPCWQRNFRYDVFGSDGRYLGQVDPPEEIERAIPRMVHIVDDQVIAAAQDEAGTITVKRYRLVPPGEG